MRALSVGVALSQSGMYALQGQQALHGLRLWVEETNAQGGLFIPELRQAVPLRLIAHDDHSRRAEVEQLIERLIAVEHVDFLIGPYSSGLAHAAAAIAEAHQKVLWNHGGSSDAIMRQGFRWAVHLPTPASSYFAGLFSCLQRYRVEAGRVAIIQRHRGTFSTEVAAGARQQAECHGFPTLPNFFYPDDPRQIPALAEALTTANPAVIIGVGRYEDDVALISALTETFRARKVVAAVAAPMQAFGQALRASAEGCIGPSQWEPCAMVPPDVGLSSAVFVEHFRQRFGQVPDYPGAQAYAAGLILQQCVRLAETCTDVELRTAAQSLTCRTVYGDFRLDAASGVQVGHEAVLVQWQAGEKKIVWPAEVAQVGLVQPRPSAREWRGDDK
jgi:branched-chain amino acid transport system substrate-binding protein